jgi:hypothetical protein
MTYDTEIKGDKQQIQHQIALTTKNSCDDLPLDRNVMLKATVFCRGIPSISQQTQLKIIQMSCMLYYDVGRMAQEGII